MGQDDDVYVKGILSKLLQGVGLGKSPPDSWSFRLGIFKLVNVSLFPQIRPTSF